MELLKSNKILFLLAGTFALFFLFGCKKEKTAEKVDKPVRVEVAYPLEREVVLSESYPGNLVALKQVDIMARVDGIIKKVHVQSGSKVKEGQLLYTIENSKYLDAVNQAKANLKTAESLYSINFHILFHGNNAGSIVITSDEPKSI